jgi:hypothetical protein
MVQYQSMIVHREENILESAHQFDLFVQQLVLEIAND